MKKFFSGIFSSAGSVVRVTISGILIAALIVSFYTYLRHTFSSTEEISKPPSELEVVLAKDFLKDYPSSPKEVIDWYNRILTLYYSENTKDSDIEKLCDQARLLMSQEILEANPRKNYIAAVLQEREEYQYRSRTILLASVTSVIIGKIGVDDMAEVVVRYTMQENSALSSHYQTYNLKMDGSRRYRIYTFELTNEFGDPVLRPQ